MGMLFYVIWPNDLGEYSGGERVFARALEQMLLRWKEKGISASSVYLRAERRQH